VLSEAAGVSSTFGSETEERSLAHAPLPNLRPRASYVALRRERVPPPLPPRFRSVLAAEARQIWFSDALEISIIIPYPAWRPKGTFFNHDPSCPEPMLVGRAPWRIPGAAWANSAWRANGLQSIRPRGQQARSATKTVCVAPATSPRPLTNSSGLPGGGWKRARQLLHHTPDREAPSR